MQQQPPQPPADAQSARIAALEALVAELRDPAKDPKIMNEGARTDPTSVLDLHSEPALAHDIGSASSPAPRSEGGRPQSRSK